MLSINEFFNYLIDYLRLTRSFALTIKSATLIGPRTNSPPETKLRIKDDKDGVIFLSSQIG